MSDSNIFEYIKNINKKSKEAFDVISRSSSKDRNLAILNTSKIIKKEQEEILKANEDFLRSAAKTEKEFQDAMDSLSKEKKEKIIESQKSGQSAEELAKLLGLKIK